MLRPRFTYSPALKIDIPSGMPRTRTKTYIPGSGCFPGEPVAIGYVLISILPTHEKTVHYRLARVPEIIEMYPVFGDYDVVAKIQAKHLDGLGDIVMERIRPIQGIRDTSTLIVTVL